LAGMPPPMVEVGAATMMPQRHQMREATCMAAVREMDGGGRGGGGACQPAEGLMTKHRSRIQCLLPAIAASGAWTARSGYTRQGPADRR
jgi:hypothetical protein